MIMNIVIEGPNVKTFARAIQSLAKLGHELSIETVPNEVILRTFNSSQSVFANFSFKQEFFVDFQEGNNVKIKVSLKSCLMAFRSLPAMEKSVEKCIMDTNTVDCTLVLQFHCRHGMSKVYHLPILSDDIIHAIDYMSEAYQCEMSVESRLFSDAVQNFNTGVEEVIFSIYNDKLILKNHIDKELEQSKTVQTELAFDSEEFEHYVVGEEVELIFCLKEFKVLLNFAEGFNVPITCKCQRGGKPLLFTVNDIPGVVPDFVVATIAQSESLPGTVVNRLSISGTSIQSKRKTPRKKNTKPRNLPNVSQSSPNHISSAISLAAVSNRDIEIPNSESEEEFGANSDNVIPSSPPNKRFRLAFLGLDNPSQNTVMAPSPDEVLAEASDED